MGGGNALSSIHAFLTILKKTLGGGSLDYADVALTQGVTKRRREELQKTEKKGEEGHAGGSCESRGKEKPR